MACVQEELKPNRQRRKAGRKDAYEDREATITNSLADTAWQFSFRDNLDIPIY